MKFLFFLALALLSPRVFAQALPTGKLTVSIIKSKMVKVGDGFKYDTKTICETTVDYQTEETRGARKTFPISELNFCKFESKGKFYVVGARYGVFAAKASIAPGKPETDLLQYLASVYVFDQNLGHAPFPETVATSFSTRDFNTKSVILELYSPGPSCAGSTGCPAPAEEKIEAVYEYEAN